MATQQGQNQRNTFAGATVVTKNARLIMLQMDISTIPEIPKLPGHQKAAKQQSQKWANNIWPLIIETTTSIIDYANTFKSSYDQLVKLVPQLEKGDAGAKDTFSLVLQDVLLKSLETKLLSAKKVTADIKAFHGAFQPLYSQFETDFKQANALMTKDNKAILDKQASLNDWQTQAKNYEKVATAMGAAMPVTASAMAAVSESGVGLIIGGIVMAGELATMATMLGLYADAMHHVADLTNQINALKAQVAQLKIIETQITGLHTETEEVVSASATVASGWNSLKVDLQTTIVDLKKITPQEAAIMIKERLHIAYDDWGVVLKQAEVLQPSGGQLKEQSFKSSADLVNALDQQAKKAGA